MCFPRKPSQAVVPEKRLSLPELCTGRARRLLAGGNEVAQSRGEQSGFEARREVTQPSQAVVPEKRLTLPYVFGIGLPALVVVTAIVFVIGSPGCRVGAGVPTADEIDCEDERMAGDKVTECSAPSIRDGTPNTHPPSRL